MLFKALLLSGLAALGAADELQFKCGTDSPTKKFSDASAKLRLEEFKLNDNARIAATEILVNVYIHVIAKDRSVEGGYVSRQSVNEQLNVLNKGYAGTGIRFVLRGSDWTVNDKWSEGREEMEMKKSLRKGAYKDLNLYFNNNPTGGFGVLGYCHFPDWAPEGSMEFTRDGCVMHAGTVPGGTMDGYNAGKVTVHEVGHWMGLMHTFQDGCIGPGDHVDDTPSQARPTWGCPIGEGLDTCPDQLGLDPIHNFMDYRSDTCWSEFTIGQINRMKSFWQLWRAST